MIKENTPKGATHYTTNGLFFKVVVNFGISKKYLYRDGNFHYCGKYHKLKPL